MANTNFINYSLLWEKICEYAKKVGRASARPVIILYYVMRSKDTPKSDKLIIFSVLAYVFFPIDLISAKRLPVIGWLDEVISLTVAVQRMSKYITPEMEYEADMLLDKWFPIYATFEEIN